MFRRADRSDRLYGQVRFARLDRHSHARSKRVRLQFRGYRGNEKILEFYISHGVGTVFPTVMTDSDETICRQLSLIAELAKEYPEIKGIHLEGPFLSEKYCGAMPTEYLQTPSSTNFYNIKSGERTYQNSNRRAELPGAIDFIVEATTAKVNVSLGHSGADGETVFKALKAGANSLRIGVTQWRPWIDTT